MLTTVPVVVLYTLPALLKKARRTLKASTNTEAIVEIEVPLRDLTHKGRGRFVDVYR